MINEQDEEELDFNEGVDVGAYEKVYLQAEVLPASSAYSGQLVSELVENTIADTDADGKIIAGEEGEKMTVLVYLSTRHTKAGTPWKEYVRRMERGLSDAEGRGVLERVSLKRLGDGLGGEGEGEGVVKGGGLGR